MNYQHLLMRVLRRLFARFLHRGLAHGIDAAARRGRPEQALSEQEREAAARAKQAAKRARQAARLLRRLR